VTSSGKSVDWEAVFTADCDPYGAGASVLFDKLPDAVTQDDRDLVKRVFMHIAARRGMGAGGPFEQALRRAADLFHEVGSSATAEDLVADCRNAILANSLRSKLRSRDQVKRITADGFELCVLALAEMGASDVTIHECGEAALGEQPWEEPMTCTGSLVHDEFTACPLHDGGGAQSADEAVCTGSLVHDEFTACPIHDRRGPRR